MGGTGQFWRVCTGLGLAGATGLLFSGCLNDPAPAPKARPVAGGWVRSTPGCEQRLILRKGGEVVLSAHITAGGGWRTEQVTGT